MLAPLESNGYDGAKMSDDQKALSAGRLAIERGETRKQRALRSNDVESTASQLSQLAARLKAKDLDAQKAGLQLLNEMVHTEAWERLKADLLELITLTERLADLDEKARAAGID